MTVVLFVFVALVLMAVLGGWLYLHLNDLAIVKPSSLQVSVSGEPEMKGRLYRLGRDTYLLVLTSPSFERPEGYWVSMRDREIGWPSFGCYTECLGYAIISRETFLRFPLVGGLEADWITNDEDIYVRITGRTLAAQEADPIDDVDGFLQRSMPLAYKNEIKISHR